REDRPVMNVFLPAKIRLGTRDGFRQRSRLDREGRLAGAVLVTGIVANGLDETHIERRHDAISSSFFFDGDQTSLRMVQPAATIANPMIKATVRKTSMRLRLNVELAKTIPATMAGTPSKRLTIRNISRSPSCPRAIPHRNPNRCRRSTDGRALP